MKPITQEKLKEMMDNKEDFVLVNVLPRESFDQKHIPGSISIPVGENFDKDAKDKIPKKDSKVIVYCANFDCQASPNAGKQLEELGYSDVSDYEGGLAEFCMNNKCASA